MNSKIIPNIGCTEFECTTKYWYTTETSEKYLNLKILGESTEQILKKACKYWFTNYLFPRR